MIDEYGPLSEAEGAVWPIQATTPALLSYAELLWNIPAIIGHNDVKRVTYLQTNHTPQMSSYPAIRTLQLKTARSCVFNVIEQLQEQNLCPDLQRVEVLPTDAMMFDAEIEFQKRLEESKKNLGFNIIIGGVANDPPSPFLTNYVSFWHLLFD